MSSQTVLVAGAGLAGLTAALDLVDAGLAVTLVERRPFAGGRTFSFTTAGGGELDNGQHVFLGCCTAYIELLRRLGQERQAYLQPRLDVRILDAELGPARLRAQPLPAPLHLLTSFLRFPYLSRRDKAGALGLLIRMRLADLPDDMTFADWLRARGQSENAIRRFWDLIVIPTCNAPSEQVSAQQAGFVYREGLLRTSRGANIGYACTGLSHIVPEPAVAYLANHGADIRWNTTVGRLETEAGVACAAITAKGERLAADAFVSAYPAEELALEWSSIVGVNLWYDRPVLDEPLMAVIVDGEAMWLFDRAGILGQTAEHHVAVSISAAGSLMDTPRDELAQAVADKLRRVLPGARQAQVLHASVEKVRRATFVPAPGQSKRRPPAVTGLSNVFLAGSWTATGWPDTMESAIRSGHTAAGLARDFLQRQPH